MRTAILPMIRRWELLTEAAPTATRPFLNPAVQSTNP
jgi:hypothetical protein